MIDMIKTIHKDTAFKKCVAQWVCQGILGGFTEELSACFGLPSHWDAEMWGFCGEDAFRQSLQSSKAQGYFIQIYININDRGCFSGSRANAELTQVF